MVRCGRADSGDEFIETGINPGQDPLRLFYCVTHFNLDLKLLGSHNLFNCMVL